MGGGPQYAHPKYVWSPAGGWWGDNVHWKRNTTIALTTMLLLGVTGAYFAQADMREFDRSPDATPQRRWAKRGVDPRTLE
ncbi:Hypothetical Protein FCC1311_103592 [Hondaea fermentalgiana]|uniref:Uncharacterized protein n=1 Tax=Hondaea fermentalgiana TaxID=2315210 RepID=A0A2R5GU97_9STRA|nr:Hypothetical Protein FCC1311_103592 [Hondaea fermentalgiana]|eukprot:GBG34135.1 Hypothetical Protein FCC1311_103592 [Hondaea fermentalgiana]